MQMHYGMHSTATPYNFVLFTDVVCNSVGWSKYAGAYKIASDSRRAGYSTQVINNYTRFDLSQLKTLVEKFVGPTTLLVGISCAINATYDRGTLQYWGISDKDMCSLLEYIKTLNSRVKIVVGGPRVYENLSWPYIDYSVVGKGDRAIVDLLNHLNHNTPLVYKQNSPTRVLLDTEYVYTQQDFETSTIDYQHNDIVLPNEALPVEIARGCIFSCSFCKFDLIGKKPGDWTKTEQTLRSELLRNYHEFGTTHYIISDELINESVEKVQMLCNVASSLPFKLGYTGYARVDLLWRYPEMRELLLDSGANALIFGIETLHPKAGKTIGKGLDPEKIKAALHYCREKWYNRVLMSSNFIIGLPHEPPEHILETFNYLTSSSSPLDVFTYTVLGMDYGKENSKNTRGLSKFEISPGKYGIKISNAGWLSTHISKSGAIKLLEFINTHPQFQNMKDWGRLKWFGRALSMGYTLEEVFHLIRNNIPLDTQEVSARFDVLTNQYYKKLLELQ